MARKPKKLNISKSEPSEESVIDRIHFDRVDNTLAKEHYGYYLICIATKSSLIKNSRVYLSYKHKKQYYKSKGAQNLLGENIYKRKPIKSKTIIFDDNKDYESLIIDTINRVFIDIKKSRLTESIIDGLKYCIDVFRKNAINVESIEEINIKQFRLVEKSLLENNERKEKRISVSKFISEVAKINNSLGKQFINLKTTPKSYKSNTFDMAIPSTVLFQLYKYAVEEFEINKNKVNSYNTWSNQFNNYSFFSLENILKTLLSEDKKYKMPFLNILLFRLKKDFNIDGSVLLYSKTKMNRLTTKEIQNINRQIESLKNKSIGGIDLLTKESHFALYWFLLFVPEYPYRKDTSLEYKNLLPKKIRDLKRIIVVYFDIKIKDLETIMFPTSKELYPLFLLLLIELGINQENLNCFQVEKNLDGNYRLKGDDIGLMTVVETTKNRSNENIIIPIKNNSKIKEYIDFYIKWCTPLYENSKSKLLLQYLGLCNSFKYEPISIEGAFLVSYRLTKNIFYDKYEIIDVNNKRLNFIEHKALRKSHLLQDHFKGKSEFERQLRKNHKSNETTKIYYEGQNLEWNGIKKHKIALAQNLIVGIFKGEVGEDEHKTAKLLNGPLADCKNNRSPSFKNAPMLKDNEHCTDWYKCLTECDKSYVIPKIHGPVIYAWINFMENQKEIFFRIEDWEKEYKLDNECAKDTISKFNDEMKNYCEKEFYKHNDFIKMKFQRTVKIKEIR
ncbi:hypothetical protein LXN10_04040 [Arcobacter sp. KX21116]|uniref:hypothetical protein n=1 Tax=Arcobacter iocasae TaxID=2906515 RepID=UPI0035D425EA